MLNGSSYVLILVVLGLAALAAAIGGTWERFSPQAYESATLQPVRAGQEDSIRRAVFADEKLWVLSDAGELRSISPEDRVVRKETVPDTTFDLCAQRGRAVIATAPRNQPGNVGIRRRQGDGWEEIARLDLTDEALVALVCEGDRVSVLTARRLIRLGAKGIAVPLSARVPAAALSVVLSTPTHIFIGFNAGEWGGGLVRIDQRTGEVRTLERNESDKLCGGPLNSQCHPVTGIAASPGRPACVVVAIGLIHMSGTGALVEVCGERISALHQERCSDDRTLAECSRPFFGLISEGDALLAVAPDKLVRLEAAGRAATIPLPEFQTYGPFQISFGPSYSLVRSNANQRHSVSGSTPMIVPH